MISVGRKCGFANPVDISWSWGRQKDKIRGSASGGFARGVFVHSSLRRMQWTSMENAINYRTALDHELSTTSYLPIMNEEKWAYRTETLGVVKLKVKLYLLYKVYLPPILVCAASELLWELRSHAVDLYSSQLLIRLCPWACLSDPDNLMMLVYLCRSATW